MSNKRRHRAILWATEGKKKSFKSQSFLKCNIEVHEGRFRVVEPPKLEPHPLAIWQPCRECGELNHRIKDKYYTIWGTCDMYCYADLVGVSLYNL